MYGPLTALSGRLPGLSTSNNQRFLVVICFCLAALGGLGLDALLNASNLRSNALLARAHWIGVAGVVAVGAAGLALVARGQGVDRLLPNPHGYVGFWLAVGVVALAGAVAFVASGFFGGPRRFAATGLCCLALLEAALFAGPFNPREPLSGVPPASPAISWLQAHAGPQPVAALGTVLIPETASLYGLTDARGYEVLSDPRERLFWSRADAGYSDSTLIMTLDRPGIDWLAAAGVAYVMMPSGRNLPGTTIVYTEPGVAIAEVPNPRPFAYAATSVASASGPEQAAHMLAGAPLGPVVVEGCCPVAGSADVTSIALAPGLVQLGVTAADRATIVVQQSYQPGWEASIDGQPAEIFPANVLFQAVTVPAGKHLITLSYRPASVTIGAITTVVGIVALIVIAALPYALRRRVRPS